MLFVERCLETDSSSFHQSFHSAGTDENLFSATTMNRFDTMADDVDKKNARSAKKMAHNNNNNGSKINKLPVVFLATTTTATTAKAMYLQHQKSRATTTTPTVRSTLRTISDGSPNPAVHFSSLPSSTLPSCRMSKDSMDHHDAFHYATIQVLEDFFDGIEEHVNVAKEIREYNVPRGIQS